jgi:SagB-type dehydrogenase family enzyme
MLFSLSLQPNISIREEASQNYTLYSPNFEFNLQQLSPGILAAIERLSTKGASEAELSDLVMNIDSASTLPQFYYYLQQFISLGLICHTLKNNDICLATTIPISTPYKLEFSEIADNKPYLLSRFAYCHQDNRQLILESPLSQAKINLTDWRSAAIINKLAQSQDYSSLTQIPGISAKMAKMFLTLLLSAKMICEVQPDGKVLEDQNNTLVQWEFHDLLFHSRSRIGRHNNRTGKSYRFLGKIDPLPAIKPKMSREVIKLSQPDLEKLQATDASFTSVLEKRKSLRVHADKPITAVQLGEFLYRSARVREIIPREYMECSNRPYPTGGACYELEIYIVVNICENISPGLYHYCPQAHELEKISEKNNYINTLLEDAKKANGEDSLPQILIIYTARFSRVNWAYEAIAYSLILKDVGILYQTMYLVATAMDLAPCALGIGNSDLFAKATGIDYYTESAVGEFILGRGR